MSGDANTKPGAKRDEKGTGVTVYFNPFAHSHEQNMEFLQRGYEVMPMQVPDARVLLAPTGKGAEK